MTSHHDPNRQEVEKKLQESNRGETTDYTNDKRQPSRLISSVDYLARLAINIFISSGVNLDEAVWHLKRSLFHFPN